MIRFYMGERVFMQKVSQEMAQQIDAAMKILVKTDFSAYMKQRQTDGLGAKKK